VAVEADGESAQEGRTEGSVGIAVCKNILVGMATAIHVFLPSSDAGHSVLARIGVANTLNQTLGEITMAMRHKQPAKVKQNLKVLTSTMAKWDELEQAHPTSFADLARSCLNLTSDAEAKDMYNSLVLIWNAAGETQKSYARSLMEKARGHMNTCRDTLALLADGMPDGASWKDRCGDGVTWQVVWNKQRKRLCCK
jgi:hypothetical protein